MADIHDVADYVICRVLESGGQLNQLKLQKLLYYIQAWHLAHYSSPLVPARFQAWIHGPVNRELYNRFRGTKTLYARMLLEDVRHGFNSDAVFTQDQRSFINSVLDVYAPLAADQLESMTHNEMPWMVARGDLPPDMRCEEELDETIMASYYLARVQG